MKTWLIDGIWQLNEKPPSNHRYQIIVTAQDEDDPIEVLNKLYDFSAMTYLRGKVTQIQSRKAFNLTPGDGITTPALVPMSITTSQTK